MEALGISEERKKGTPWRFYCLIISILVVSLVTVALVAVLVHRSLTTRMTEKSLRERFPGYFRYAEEQELFAESSKGYVNATETVSLITAVGGNSSMSGECTAPTPDVPITPARSTIYNGCCKSEQLVISPSKLQDNNGIMRTLAVFKNPDTGRSARQYFFTESCKTIDGCQIKCQCRQANYTFTGVYDAGAGEYGVAWFRQLGCCKCVNN